MFDGTDCRDIDIDNGSNIEVDDYWRVDVEDPDQEVKATHEGKRLGGLKITAESAGQCFRRSFGRFQVCNITSKSMFMLKILLVLENNIAVYYNRKYYFIK